MIWEYLSLAYSYNVRMIPLRSEERLRLPAKEEAIWMGSGSPRWRWGEATLKVRSSATEDVSEELIWDSGKDHVDTDVHEIIHRVLNELGTEGWELVSETVLTTVLSSTDEVMMGHPASTVWRFKRQSQ